MKTVKYKSKEMGNKKELNRIHLYELQTLVTSTVKPSFKGINYIFV